MRIGMLFPGQGAQFVGMGRDLYDAFDEARDVYRRARATLGFDIAELSFSGDLQTLTETRNAQPAILVHSVAALAVLAARGVEPAVVAGHSLGEFSALVAAGVFEPMDALRLVRTRGELMYAAGLERPGTMAAVVGLDREAVARCLEGVTDGVVVIANENAPTQFVISGEIAAVDAACEAARAAGARRAMRLTVSGAFHSPLLEPAATEFRRALEKTPRGRLRVPWVANVTGDVVEDADAVVELLARQLASPVRWVDAMRAFETRAPERTGEVGPGRVLAGLMKRIAPGVSVEPLGTAEAIDAFTAA